MTAPTRTSAYDQYADEYAAYVAPREQDDLVGDPFGILMPLLAQLGDVSGQDVLDAGCGEGYLSRILAARGACVTGVDLAPRLIALAGQKASASEIDSRVADRSGPLRRDCELPGPQRRRGVSRLLRDPDAVAEDGRPGCP